MKTFKPVQKEREQYNKSHVPINHVWQLSTFNVYFFIRGGQNVTNETVTVKCNQRREFHFNWFKNLNYKLKKDLNSFKSTKLLKLD